MYTRKIVPIEESFIPQTLGKNIAQVVENLRQQVKQIGWLTSFEANFADVNFWGKHYSKEKQVLYPFEIRFFNGVENVLIYGKSTEENTVNSLKVELF